MNDFLIPIEFSTVNKDHVYLLQSSLILFGKEIDENEILNREFGVSTQAAVASFQLDYGIAQTKGLSIETINKLNELLSDKYRIYGNVYSTNSIPIEEVTVEVFYKPYLGSEVQLGIGLSLSDGSFRVFLTIPEEFLNKNKLLKNQLCIIIRCYQNNIEKYVSEKLFISEKENIFTFISENFVYTGTSIFEKNDAILQRYGLSINALTNASKSDLKVMAATTGIDIELLMKFIMSSYLDNYTEYEFNISKESTFGYLYQGYPKNIPVQLFIESISESDWSAYKTKIRDLIIAGLLLIDSQDHINILKNAVLCHYIPFYDTQTVNNVVVDIIKNKNNILEYFPLFEKDVSMNSLLSQDFINDVIDYGTVYENKCSSGYIVPEYLSAETAEIISEFHVAFDGNINWIDNGNLVGNYVSVKIYPPYNIDDTSIELMYDFSLLKFKIRGQTKDYNSLSDDEKNNKFIRVNLNYTHIQNPNDFIIVDWSSECKEIYSVHLKDTVLLAPNPSTYIKGHIELDTDFDGGEECIYTVIDNNSIQLSGKVDYSTDMYVGNYVGVKLFMPSDLIELSGIYCKVRGFEKTYATLTNEEIIGRFIRFYLDYTDEIPQVDTFFVQWAEGRKEVYSLAMSKHTVLKVNSSIPEIKQGIISNCDSGGTSYIQLAQNYILYTGTLNWSNNLGGNYISIDIEKPTDIEGWEAEFQCIVRGKVFRLNNYISDSAIRINLNYKEGMPPTDLITIQWTHERVEYFYVGTENLYLSPNPSPNTGWIRRDFEWTGGNQCNINIVEHEIEFYDRIEWSYLLGGNYIGVIIYAPDNITDLNQIQYNVRNVSYDVNSLIEAEKRNRYIHLLLRYDSVPYTDTITVRWNNTSEEETYTISIDENCILSIVSEWNSDVWKRRLSGLFIKNINNFNAFISDLTNTKAYFLPANIEKLKLCFQISRVVRNYSNMIYKVWDVYSNELLIKGIRYIAAYSLDSWKSFVNDPSVGYPDDFSSGDSYATLIFETAQKLYPEMSCVSKLKTISEYAEAATTLESKLLENPTFNLLTDRIDKLDIPMGDIKEKIQIIQNVYRITPNAVVTSKVLQEGVSNAEQVYRIGKKQLQERFKSTLSQKEIISVFQAASARYSTAMSASANISNSYNSANFVVVDSSDKEEIIEELKADFPDISTLFGSSDYCECPNDSSVYSAAAYLADILAFIDERKAKSDSAFTVKHYLDLRRSDISNIYLNVQNTKTMVPYIDLVCEVLEEATININSPAFQRSEAECQSTLTSKELCAAPEHILSKNNQTAYDYISESMYPMYAPLNLWEMEIRDYLKYIGVERYDLMKIFQQPISTPSPKNEDIAAEYFGLTYMEQQIVPATNTYSIAQRNVAWQQIFDPETYTVMLLNKFITDTELTIHEVLDLVNDNREDDPIIGKPIDDTKLRWTNLVWSVFTDNCTSENQYIDGSDLHFDRAHRFIRLWRKSGWKMWELDLLLRNSNVTDFTNFTTDNLDIAALSNLMQFKQQQETLGLSVDALLAFYGNINILDLRENTILQACLYDRVFLRKSLSNPLNENLVEIKDGDTITLTTEDKHLIAACLSVSDEELDTLITYYGLDDSFNLAKISFVFRQVVLMQKLKLSMKEFLLVLEFTGIDLTDSVYNYIYTLDAIETVLKAVKDIKKSKLSIIELEYIVKYKDYSSISGISSEAIVLALPKDTLDEHTNALNEIISNSNYPVAPTNDDIEEGNESYFTTDLYKSDFRNKMLAIDKYNNIDDIEDLIQIIECTTSKTDLQIDDFTARLFPVISEVVLGDNLHNMSFESKDDLKDRYIHVVDYVVKTTSMLLIENYLSNKFVLSGVITEAYLTYKLDYENRTNLLNILLIKDNYLGTTPTSTIHVVLNLMNKLTLLLKRNNITVDEFSLLLELQKKGEDLITKLGIFTFNWFGFLTNDTLLIPTVLYNDLVVMEKMISWHKKFGETKDKKTLLSIIIKHAGIPIEQEGNFFDDLTLLTQWNYDLMYIKTNFGWNMSTFYSSLPFNRISDCIDLKSIVGLSIDAVDRWRLRETSVGITEKTRNGEVKDAVKSKYTIDTWLDKLPDIQKPIREAKSNALACYLISYSSRHSQIWNDKADLYAYFLLDTEMSACMQTSRIVQASCSVQLFVQRCFLNLESDIFVNDNYDGEWRQWEWMKKYRLWEANRKVFLYPENWIEPELRDDKTSLFKELEDELNQGEITDSTVESAFENYLQKLHVIANLEVCGIYQEMVDGNDGYQSSDSLKQDSSKVNITHVIARTKSTPYQHYYRKYDMLSNIWSEWEKVDLDIKESVVVPYVYNRKLHLFWLNKVEKTYNNSTKDNAQNSYEYTENQLMWSVLKNNKWTRAKSSQKKHINLYHYFLSSYSLMVQYDNISNQLMVNIYNSTSQTQKTTYFGVFYFNGDVYRVVTFFQKLDKQDSSNGHEFTKYSLGEDKQRQFNLITKNMDVDAKPEPYKIYIIRDANVFFPPYNIYASRFYMNLEDNYVNILGYNLLKNNKRNPNIVQMIHCELPLYYGIYVNCTKYPFFYQDSDRSFYVQSKDIINYKEQYMYTEYNFVPFYHPYSTLFIKELNRDGIKALLCRNIQLNPYDYYPKNSYTFQSVYQPSSYVKIPDNYQKEIVDFDLPGSYSIYNWELFFHAPLYIACKLNQNQKFEEAMKWFHYIFNPTTKESGESPQKFWITKPFFEMTTTENRKQQITNILTNIKNCAAEVNAWLNNPYKPHLIARTRPVAYQRTVVMKYVDNIIDWADYLFRLNTREYNNEATLLYILAGEILGKRPNVFPSKKYDLSINFNTIKNTLFNVSNWSLQTMDISIVYAYAPNQTLFTVATPQVVQSGDYKQVSNYNDVLEIAGTAALSASTSEFSVDTNACLPSCPTSASEQTQLTVQGQLVNTATVKVVSYESIPRIDSTHFCLPPNDQLLGYWDLVEDRLFKLRNCLNIDGETNELALFEPPIDPALLVKASAAGLSIGNILSEINIPQPYYRFKVLIQKAIEYTGEVKQLGDKLLSTLEKKDAETLNQLRSTQEINLQQASLQVKKMQIEEAVKNLENVNESIKIAQAKYDYYSSRELMNTLENDAYALSSKSLALNDMYVFGQKMAAILAYIPNFGTGGAGAGGSPFVNATIGGTNFATALNASMAALAGTIQQMDKEASHLLTKAGYTRRKEDWDFQADLAKKEITQLNKQYVAAEIRLAIAEKELSNMEMQIEQSKSILEYYENKYSNEELYNWMLTQISSVYFDAYKLAYDMAMKAQKCYCQELGILDEKTVQIIQYGNWDSLRKGLLSGEYLMHNLHQLDTAYINNNKRTFELTKHISLAQMFPAQLLDLVTNLKTDLDLEEFIFDMDYPGHYLRRIKSVTVTIPNVAGPYTNVSFALKLKNAKVRVYPLKVYDREDAFIAQTGANQSICTSSAQNDSGMFEFNFNDERYLPFENAGVISSWQLSLPAGCNQFDLSSISDVILHINYTARYDGVLAVAAKTALTAKLPTAGRMFFSLKQDFPDAWAQMTNMEMTVTFKTEHIPFFLRGDAAGMKVNKINLIFSSKEEIDPTGKNIVFKGLTLPLSTIVQQDGDIYLYSAGIILQSAYPDCMGNCIINFSNSGITDMDTVEDVICSFELFKSTN